jgi:hypothetical protein
MSGEMLKKLKLVEYQQGEEGFFFVFGFGSAMGFFGEPMFGLVR